MKEIPGIRFRCPDCNTEMKIQIAVWEDSELILLGACDDCGEVIRFRVDAIVEALLQSEFQPTNKGKVN